MDLIVGNSIVKYWGEETGARVFCLPGATLDVILDKAVQEHQDTDRYVYLQSGIPDMHRKWEHSGILPERLDLYKRNLRKVHKYLPKAIILMIYPPLNAPHGVCEQYHEVNKMIVQLNKVKTPNTISRIFHRGHNNIWRVESARLSDGIHPTRQEVSRMVRRLESEVGTLSSSHHLGSLEREETVKSNKKRIRTEDEGVQPESSEGSTKLMVTIEGSSSSSEKFEQLLIRKKRKLEELKAEFARKEKEIEEECVREMRELLQVEEGSKAKKPKSMKSLRKHDAELEVSPMPALEKKEDNQEEFVVLDEWRSGHRDIRENVPRRVYYC